jgi:hypothetical protein
MGFYLLPLMVFIFFLGLIQAKDDQAQRSAPSKSAAEAVWYGQEFVAYRDAVMAYHQQYPGVSGTVAATQLWRTFSPRFLALASNRIVNPDGGRVGVVCWANLPGGAFAAALAASQNDASFGTATTATTWTSATYNAAAQTLPGGLSVPAGAVVSYFQTGN